MKAKREGVAGKSLIAVMMLMVMYATGSAEWHWQFPKPQGNTLRKTSFAGARYGYAVGDNGTIMATCDGAVTWQLQYEAVTDNLRDVAAIDSLTACAVGDNGMILHTTDGGYRWIEQPSGTANGLNSVFFLDRIHGWAAGDAKTILFTTDGGATWNKATLPTESGNAGINAITFFSAMNGYAVGYGGGMGSGNPIFRTTDGGVSWTTASSSSAALQRLKVLQGTSTAFAVGKGGLILTTTNEGATWTSIPSGVAGTLNDIVFASTSEFWIAGDDSTLLHSTNAGVSWTFEPFHETYASVNGIAVAGNDLVAVGEYGFLARRNVGNPWTIINAGNFPSINWLTFADSRNGIGVGQWGYMLHTTDGGSTWAVIHNTLTGDSFYGAAYVGSKIWVVGDLGVVLYSSNHGSSWVQQTTSSSMTLLSVSFPDESNGQVVGDNGTLLRTTNGGNSWQAGVSGVTTTLCGITMNDPAHGWMAGEYGVIRATMDGSTWGPQASPVASVLWNTEFRDAMNGYCAGGNGVILRTTNGGGTWLPAPSGTTRNIWVVSGGSATGVLAVGDTGLVLRSTDGGVTWAQEFALCAYDLFSLRTFTDSVAWISGDNGTVLVAGTPGLLTATATGQRTGEVGQPASFVLEQNYPNPFNPSTTIRYHLARSTYVHLGVYSVLGEEVTILVDGVQGGGGQEVVFDTAKLRGGASGALFYRLQAGGRAETRPCILLR